MTRRPTGAPVPRAVRFRPAGSGGVHLRRGLLQGFVIAVTSVAGVTGSPPEPLEAQERDRIDLDRVVRELEPEIRRAMTEGRIPSMAIALVSGDEILWSQGYGYANLYTRSPATASTVYMVASTFKTMAASAVLALWEEGRFELDDPVRDYLGDLEIPGENPNRPITFRQLLTHTSGIPSSFSPVPVWADSVPTSMEPFLRSQLGAVSAPLEQVRYSNMGYTLLAYLVERLTGVEFRTWVRNRIFGPMAMGSTDFIPSAEMVERMAIPYMPEGRDGPLLPADRLRFAEWPAGGAWGTVQDQARWLGMNLNGGVFQGRRILSEETLREAHTHQFPDFTGSMAGGWGGDDAGYGLAWWTSTREGERYIAHSGSVRGYTAFLHGNLDRAVGVAILTNGHRAHPHLVRISYLATDLMGRHRSTRSR
jgi:CubicO group peptidase (beta-lactamase class C family)